MKGIFSALGQFGGLGATGFDPAAGGHLAVFGVDAHHDAAGVAGRQLVNELWLLQGHRAEDHPIQAAGQQLLGPRSRAHATAQLYRYRQGGGDRLHGRVIHR